MSAIERFFAAILLAAAVGGTAAFARHVVSSPTASAPIRLNATEPQHDSAPSTVWAPVQTPVRPLTRPSLQAAVAVPAPARRSAPPAVATRPIVVPRVTKPRLVAPTPAPPAPIPAAPTPTVAPPPTQVPDTPRVLATLTPAPPESPVVVLTPTQGHDGGNDNGDNGNGNNGNGNGHDQGNEDNGHAWGAGRDNGHGKGHDD